MKTTVKQLAAGTFITIILFVGNGKAEAKEIKASGCEIMETVLQLEDWMIDEANWNTNTVNMVEFIQETEAELELEDWMANAELWNVYYSFVEEVESALELEDWMIGDGAWNMADTENELEITVEPWMLNENF